MTNRIGWNALVFITNNKVEQGNERRLGYTRFARDPSGLLPALLPISAIYLEVLATFQLVVISFLNRANPFSGFAFLQFLRNKIYVI